MDTQKYYLGKLCPRNHEYKNTGMSVLLRSNSYCHECKKLTSRLVAKKYYLSKKKAEVVCKQCRITFTKRIDQIKQWPNHFCTVSCHTRWLNTHKTKCYSRSKLELYLERTLKKNYPDLEIVFNDRNAIGSELDIYFPTVKLAVELNGIFHYEPIYGLEKLDQIQRNDKRKIINCAEQGIELLILDTTSKGKRKYYNIIKRILEKRLSI